MYAPWAFELGHTPSGPQTYADLPTLSSTLTGKTSQCTKRGPFEPTTMSGGSVSGRSRGLQGGLGGLGGVQKSLKAGFRAGTRGVGGVPGPTASLPPGKGVLNVHIYFSIYTYIYIYIYSYICVHPMTFRRTMMLVIPQVHRKPHTT